MEGSAEGLINFIDHYKLIRFLVFEEVARAISVLRSLLDLLELPEKLFIQRLFFVDSEILLLTLLLHEVGHEQLHCGLSS